MFSPDGGEQEWEERKLRSIISTDFIDLIISDSWGSWMLFLMWFGTNQLSFLWESFFSKKFFQTKRNFEQERQLCGKCMSFVVWRLYPNSRSVAYLHMTLNYKLLSFSEPIPPSESLEYCYVPKNFHWVEKIPNILIPLVPSHFPLEATPHRWTLFLKK